MRRVDVAAKNVRETGPKSRGGTTGGGRDRMIGRRHGADAHVVAGRPRGGGILNGSFVPQVYWSEGGEMFAITCEGAFYVLRFNREAAEAKLGKLGEDEGIEEAFDVVSEVPETYVRPPTPPFAHVACGR